jgi:hypothetical protein
MIIGDTYKWDHFLFTFRVSNRHRTYSHHAPHRRHRSPIPPCRAAAHPTHGFPKPSHPNTADRPAGLGEGISFNFLVNVLDCLVFL